MDEKRARAGTEFTAQHTHICRQVVGVSRAPAVHVFHCELWAQAETGRPAACVTWAGTFCANTAAIVKQQETTGRAGTALTKP